MLDKKSYKVLKYAVSQYKGNDDYIEVSPKELDIPYETLNMVCNDLREKGYIQPFYYAYNNNDIVQLTLTNKALNYKIDTFHTELRYWLPICISILSLLTSIGSMIISIIALTQ